MIDMASIRTNGDHLCSVGNTFLEDLIDATGTAFPLSSLSSRLMNRVHDFARFKAEGRKISIVATYDAWSARIVARSNVDAVLVGDSAAMVVHGHPTTLAATVGQMAAHTRAVARAAPEKFEFVRLLFEVRYDGRTSGETPSADVYYDDLHFGEARAD